MGAAAIAYAGLHHAVEYAQNVLKGLNPGKEINRNRKS